MPVLTGIINHKVIGDFMNTTALILEVTPEEKSIPGEMAEAEIAKWKAAFQQIGWLEDMGPKTRLALSNSKDHFGLLTEPVLFVTYEETTGTHFTGFWFNQINLFEPYSALIATSKRLLLVDPMDQIVHFVEYKNIVQIEREIRANTCIYTLLLKSGDSIHIRIRFDREEDEIIVNAFFERIAASR